MLRTIMSLLKGAMTRLDGLTTTLGDPLQDLYFFDAQASGIEVWLTGIHLMVEWSEFDQCHFRQRSRPVLNCRWEGHFAYETQLIGCRFVGRINGCAWGGESSPTNAAARRNVITGNDFSRARITDNVGWRAAFPLSDQIWPAGYVPVPDE